jgi:hypothetical protein
MFRKAARTASLLLRGVAFGAILVAIGWMTSINHGVTPDTMMLVGLSIIVGGILAFIGSFT